jgi:hypothetical protein
MISPKKSIELEFAGSEKERETDANLEKGILEETGKCAETWS